MLGSGLLSIIFIIPLDYKIMWIEISIDASPMIQLHKKIPEHYYYYAYKCFFSHIGSTINIIKAMQERAIATPITSFNNLDKIRETVINNTIVMGEKIVSILILPVPFVKVEKGVCIVVIIA